MTMSVRRHPAVGPTGAMGATGPQGTAPAGTPVLHGPYVVDYTAIPHDGDTLTLWTPQVGDVLLHLFPDWHTVVQWDHGGLWIGQNVDGTVGPPHNTLVASPILALGPPITYNVETMDTTYCGDVWDSSGVMHPVICNVFTSADPVQIQLAQTGGTSPTTGHVELYALVARAVAP